MRNFYLSFIIQGIFLCLLPGCDKQQTNPQKPLVNPFTGLIEWNGFVFDTTRYQTPQAYLEDWGENLDSLSTDFDIKFTDGTFDSQLHDVSNYSILVYFDANSPSVDALSEGTYTVDRTHERKPGNIVEAWIEIFSADQLERFKITSGTVNVQQKDGYTLITYDAILNNTHRINGQYSGKITPILQILGEK